ncbi:MAG: Peptide/nickel transport system ATP-binding protein/oligopeptide transport system ATP-binding [Amycolatopsis sp.]|jgi:oligopeptide/dipeptide ABC transporter ATP-binding protein|uniref:ABC transporter ATP-binding protein n=1 Tax=Amycolatopsis sp. TaxID=37632 RepID=UPI00261DDB2D|nr:ABC transporter ATP-binding protein [Amycolatopsis sp.]MCU1680403.1 Peptide/nickel transport system ATP-binding protein/oligopeptide transport system ATP-binding [Amycolatopsis sp.]
MTAPVLEVRDLHVEIPLPHGRLHAVRGVSLAVDAGESVGLVGESGSGKSLTLRALLGLLPRPAKITSGTVLIDGEDVTGLPAKRLRRKLTDTMAMIFQDSLTALNPVHRVGDQIAETPLRRLGKSRGEAKSIAVDLMREVGIADPERRYELYPHELSGGMRQRICIAIALSTKPRLILADEPTTALDVTIQAQVLALLRQLRRDEHVGLLLVSHDLAVVSQTCSRLYVMYAGKIAESGRLPDLITAPEHPYTFSLLRSVPDPDHRAARLLAIPGQPPDLSETVLGCSFAPRCPFVADECRTAEPEPVPTASGHSACLRTETARTWPMLITGEGAAQW